MARVLCAGHVNWDVTLQVDRLPGPDGEAQIVDQCQSGGGSASNVAVLLAGLDVETTLLGSVGADEHGWLAARELDRAGVETVLVEADDATAVKYLVVDEGGEVMMLGNDGANESFRADDLEPGTLDATDRLHLTSQRPATAVALARRATEAGCPVSFDPGRRLDERDYEPVLAAVDLVFLNRREADIAAEAGLLSGVDRVVVKHGAGGAEVRTDGETISHPGFAVDPVDTTGAGDAFAAGFLAASQSGSDEYALAVGNACGALAARTTGARLHAEWRDVEALLDIGPGE
ncbi:carbohydrate kinase family protein [Halomicrobium katesii]|uniref:carbohydrate kinase family protein n=1 Tax=Halomicrobium katesii TaxID=437163 RepID=UPI00037E1324|nr:carbohydrate kinase family protein [Halomicrobium katesii]